MAKMQEFKCPCCGGSIEFDSSAQKMKCPFCDTEFDVKTLSEHAKAVEEEQPEDMIWSERVRDYVLIRVSPVAVRSWVMPIRQRQPARFAAARW